LKDEARALLGAMLGCWTAGDCWIALIAGLLAAYSSLASQVFRASHIAALSFLALRFPVLPDFK
jgi:hypothetical protein